MLLEIVRGVVPNEVTSVYVMASRGRGPGTRRSYVFPADDLIKVSSKGKAFWASRKYLAGDGEVRDLKTIRRTAARELADEFRA